MILLGMVLMSGIGLVHAVQVDEYSQYAPYLGALFVANAVGAAVVVAGLGLGIRRPAWGLGLVIAAGAFVAYVVSRTVGLPSLPADDAVWTEPLGIASLLLEAAFVALAARGLTRRRGRRPPPDRGARRERVSGRASPQAG